MSLFVKNRTSERGASMVEYSLLVALIGIVSLVAAGGVGQATEDQFDVIAAGLGDNGENSDQAVEEESGDNEEETPEGDEDADDPQGGHDEDPADPDYEDEDPADPDGEDPVDPQDEDEDQEGVPGDDEEDTEPTEEPVVPGSVVADAGSSGSYYWWNDSKHGGEGAWKASVKYQNDWIRHQYLTLEVTRVDGHGNRSSTTVNSFYVPAQGTSNYDSWDNALRLHKGDFSGVLAVEVKVVAIQTSDERWATVSYTTDGPTTVITPPQTP